MPGSPPESAPRSPDPTEGPAPRARKTLSSMGQGLQQYLEARGELFAIESREAGRHATRKGILGVALVVAAFFAYGLILCAAVSLAGGWLEARFPKQFSTIGWECAALLAGLLHIALAFGLLFLLRRKPAAPLFDVTRQEFQKDRQWIQDQQSANENKS